MKGKVLLAKPGLDGHEAGVMLVGRALHESGFEVIYLGLRQTADMIARAAVSEDADVIGLSVLTGGHVQHAQQLMTSLEADGAADIPVIMGGIISLESGQELLDAGVTAYFGPGRTLTEIVACFEETCRARR